MGVLAAAMEAGLRSIKVVSTADVWTIESGKVKKDTGKIEFRPAEAFVLLQGSLGFKYQSRFECSNGDRRLLLRRFDL